MSGGNPSLEPDEAESVAAAIPTSRRLARESKKGGTMFPSIACALADYLLMKTDLSDFTTLHLDELIPDSDEFLQYIQDNSDELLTRWNAYEQQ